jgi:NAD(P)-dependent dehydrogenase (short-subunit alcohol dehydrogenase family)
MAEGSGPGSATLKALRPDSRHLAHYCDIDELHFAVNYLAPFLLTRLLAPLLIRSAPARVVNVASIGQAPIVFDDPMVERGYDGATAYQHSKLALVMSPSTWRTSWATRV